MNHILLLEDIPEIRAWLKALVKQVFANAQITECSRVQDALSLVNGQRFTLALLDLGLPDGSGVEVIAALREKQPEVQSVIVTIHDDDEHLFPALQAGAFGYLLKEQSRELLVEQLQRMSQGEPPLSPSIARKVIAYFAAQVKKPTSPLLHEVSLTDRETEVLALLGQGFSNREIGERLGISAHTAKFHVQALLEKLDATTRTEAAVRAARMLII